MTTHTVSHHPVRSDVPSPDGTGEIQPTSTKWALAGVAAGIAGLGAIASSLAVDAVYDERLDGDTTAISDKLADQVPQMLAFHVLAMVSAILVLVFAAGLHRRLRATSGAASLAPVLAFSGLLMTAVVLVLGTGLNTEFIFAAGDHDIAAPDNVALYNHWIGTIPWCWGLLGLSGIALFGASRAGGVPRWIGLVGLLGGGLTLLIGISPLQYMAGFTGPVGLVVISLGFLLGDKVFRGRA